MRNRKGLLQTLLLSGIVTAYNPLMKRAACIFCLLCLPTVAPLMAQESLQESQLLPSPPMQDAAGRIPPRLMPDLMEERREEARRRREAMQQMSPEERHQLRRDIRDAGRMLYPRGPRRHSN